jgi:micrococcal nuclease
VMVWLEGCGSPLLVQKPDTVISGTVLRVMDGDTMLLTVGEYQAKVRLARIDAPEKSQPFGSEAKACLEGMVTGRVVRVLCLRTDLYNRTVGDVFYDSRSVNEDMVAKGMAWQYVKYDRSVDIMRLEIEARVKRVGLWAQEKPEPPWEYRNNNRRMEP